MAIGQDKDENERFLQELEEGLDGNVTAQTFKETLIGVNRQFATTTEAGGGGLVPSEVKTAYETNADTNAFTDAEQTKLGGVETGATADQTNVEIKTAYETNTNTNAFTDTEQTKLGGLTKDFTALDNIPPNERYTPGILILFANTVTDQAPTAVDDPIQVNFGAGALFSNPALITLNAIGDVTFLQAMNVRVFADFNFSRTGSGGTAEILGRLTMNGTQIGKTLLLKVDSENISYPVFINTQLTVAANDVLRFEIVRDSEGVNAGGIMGMSPTTVAWNDAPSAELFVRTNYQ